MDFSMCHVKLLKESFQMSVSLYFSISKRYCSVLSCEYICTLSWSGGQRSSTICLCQVEKQNSKAA